MPSKMTFKMEFNCKMAHLDDIKRLTNFNSTKELYERISQNFSVPINEILYCTLNSHNFRDMEALLGNYLSSNDLIVVHLCGKSRDLTIKKTQDYLGLTITDNGQGRAFVKKVKSEDENVARLIKPGDHIVAINSESTIGMRHYEVAKAIREIPLNSTFAIRLVEPKHSDSYLDKDRLDRDLADNGLKTDISLLGQQDIGRHKNGNNELNSLNSQDLSYVDDLINSSLPMDRLLSKRSTQQADETNSNQQRLDVNNTNHQDNNYKHTIDKINSILESFLGINDNILAIRIYRLAHENKNSYRQFSGAIKTSELNVFNFDDDIQNYLWNCATRVVV